jgi:hypothetical protein
MKTIEEIRHARFQQVASSAEYPSLDALSKAIGRSQGQVSQWKNRSRRTKGGHCNIDSASARHIEQRLGLPHGWLDSDPDRDLSKMAETVARWFDHHLPEDKRLRAFWIVHQMVIADEWPPESATVPLTAPGRPSTEPSEELAPSESR